VEIKSSAEKELAKAIPALESATKCLNKLAKADIVGVKALSNPPQGVRTTIMCVCIMFGVKPDMVPDPDSGGTKKKEEFWKKGQGLLANPQAFLTSLFDYDRANMKEEWVLKAAPIIRDESFAPKVIKGCCTIYRVCCILYIRSSRASAWPARPSACGATPCTPSSTSTETSSPSGRSWWCPRRSSRWRPTAWRWRRPS
jgi:dynein heavy chain